MSERANPAPCPDQVKGKECWLCGSKYVCTEPWRKKRTVKERIKAREEFLRKRKEK